MTIQQIRATVDGDALAAALRRLEKCASPGQHNRIAILSGVMIESDGAAGLLRLYSTDLERQAVVTVPAVIEGGGRAVPILAPLAALLAKMPKGAHVELTGRDDGEGAALLSRMSHGGMFRASLAGFNPDAFPVMATRAAAWSLTMPAGPLLAILASAAKDAKPPGAGDSKGARFTFAADALTVTAGAGRMMTRRRYPLPRLMAAGLAFKPKEGAAIDVELTADAVKALADAIPKPAKDAGDGAAVTVGFAVDGGAVVAAMIDTGEALVTVKASPGECAVTAGLDAAPRLEWFTVAGDDLARALESMAKGDDGKADNFAVRSIGEGGSFDLIPAGGGACTSLPAARGVDFDAAEPVGIPMLAARAAKGGGLVTVYQLAGDMAGRGMLALAREDGALVYVSGFAEAPAVRFGRVYGAAWRARDRAGMVAAVAAYRAARGRAPYARRSCEAFGDDVAKLAAAIRRMKPGKAALAKAGGLKPGNDPGSFARDPKRYAWQGDNSFTHRVATLGERIDATRAAESRRLEYEAGKAAALAEHAANEARGYHVRMAYGRGGRPNGKMVVTPAAVDGDWHQRASRLAYSCGGQHDGRAGGYLLTAPQAERFESLFAAGFDGVPGLRSICHPEGLPVPKVTRAKKAASDAPEAPPAVITPEHAPEAASEPESAPVAAIEPESPADDAGAFYCQSCGREEGECSANPCEAVQDDREATVPVDAAPDLAATVAELLTRVAALESARPVAVEPEAAPAVNAGGDDLATVTAQAEYWRRRALDASEQSEKILARFGVAEMVDYDRACNERDAALADAKAARADLAAMTAERDALAADVDRMAEWSRFTRRLTAKRLRDVRATAREAEALHGAARNDATQARAQSVADLKARLDAQGQVEALERQLARYKASGALPAMRYVPAHIGTMRPAEPINPQVGARRAA